MGGKRRPPYERIASRWPHRRCFADHFDAPKNAPISSPKSPCPQKHAPSFSAVRKSKLADTLQLSLAGGSAGRDGRHPPCAPGGDGAPAGSSRLAHRLGRRAALAGFAGRRRLPVRPNPSPASRRSPALCRDESLAQSSLQSPNPLGIQGFTHRTEGRRVRRGSRPARRNPLLAAGAAHGLQANHRRGRTTGARGALAAFRARLDAHRARD